MYTSPLDQLRSAVESGDVLELEEAINRARAVTGGHSPSFTALHLKAQDIFARHMRDCRGYLKPLRSACAKLDESAIFQALLQVQEAPETVQLMMYSDIRNAEDLREDIITAQEAVLDVLDCEDWHAIDRFLKQSAAVLDDRSVLALVQRREDLIKNTTTSASHRARSASLGPPRSMPMPATHGQRGAAQRRPSPATHHQRYGPEASPVNDPRGLVPVLQRVRSDKMSRGSSAATAAMMADETAQRELVQRAEYSARVSVYTSALLPPTAATDVASSGAAEGRSLFPTLEDLSFLPDQEDPIVADSPLPPPLPPQQQYLATEPEPVPRRSAPAPQSINSSTVTGATPVTDRVFKPVVVPSEASRAETPSTIVSARLQSLNLSPIAHMTGSPAGVPADGSAMQRSSNSRTTLTNSAPATAGGVNDSVGGGVVLPIRRPPEPITAPTVATARAPSSSADVSNVSAHRVAARLRAVVRDEDIRRQDIEGTEEFDRSVFLMPIAARIELMRRAQQQKQAALRLY